MDDELKAIARSLIWWKPPEEVSPDYLIRRVMNVGTWTMVKTIERMQGETAMRRALETAEPGEFSERAWNFWHLRFGVHPIPPLPRREIPFIPLPYVLAQSGDPASSPTRTVAETSGDP